MKIEEDRVELSSGAVIDAYGGVIGLSHDLRVYGGYDDSCADLGFTVADRQELAEYMIEQWKRFAAAAPPTDEAY